jgi:hypothetical protein
MSEMHKIINAKSNKNKLILNKDAIKIVTMTILQNNEIITLLLIELIVILINYLINI